MEDRGAESTRELEHFMLCGINNVLNLTSTLIGPLLEHVPSAIAGGVIAVVLGKIR
jgi:hypothetical protein